MWVPSQDKIKNANMTRFIEFVNKKYGKKFRTYDELYQWSVGSIPDFWVAMWDFAGVKASKRWDQVVEDLKKFPGTKWFPGAKLNFAENLLRYRDDRVAFVFKGETQKSAKMTYKELYNTVARLAKSLREIGIQPGDRVAGYMPNMMETAIGMLAAASIGAVWSSCATDIGPQAALDRLGQIEPKVLFSVDGYFYKAKPFNTLGNAAEVAKAIPSLRKSSLFPIRGLSQISGIFPMASITKTFWPRKKNQSLSLSNYLLTILSLSCFPQGRPANLNAWCRGRGGFYSTN